MSMGATRGDSHRPVTPGRPRLVAPADWAVWAQPRPVIGYVVTVAAIAVTATASTLQLAPIDPGDLGVFAILVACCVGYGEASRRIERTRRQYSGTPHIDLNSVWMFAGVLLLHPALTAALITTFYTHRWLRVAHRIVHRVVFNVSAAVCSATAATGFLALADRYHAFVDMPRDVPNFALVAVAALAFLVVNTILVSTAVALSTPEPSLRTVTAAWSDYALEAATLALGALLAWALADWPIMAAPIIGITLVMHGKVLIHQLKEAARTDAKTGLLNAAAWYESARRELTRASRHGPSVGLLIIDLDYFKKINDVHGHPAGDEILRAVADAIIAQVRGYDLLGRFGGDELLALLPNIDGPNLVRVAERIRREIADLVLPVQANRGTVLFRGLTAFIGIAQYPRHGETLEQLIRAADQALLTAKEAGRDQIQLAGTLGPESAPTRPLPRVEN